MAKSFQNLFQLFRRIKKNNQNNYIPMMGRWNLEYDNTIQNQKVYWANMDNCGCCDQKIIIEKITHTDSDEYILPYVM
jgi:hypothetical protein